jgi:hypothetical protein
LPPDENADSVHIDVWNFESMTPAGGDSGMVDRLRRLSEVKDGRGLKQLLVEAVAPPASDRLIGHVEIPLATLPACGSNTWWQLYKLDGKVKKDRGEIHLIQHLFVREGRLKEHTRYINAAVLVVQCTSLLGRGLRGYICRYTVVQVVPHSPAAVSRRISWGPSQEAYQLLVPYSVAGGAVCLLLWSQRASTA